jgi:hypothetical protein
MSRRPIAVAPQQEGIYGAITPPGLSRTIIIDHLVTVDGPESALDRGVTLRLTTEQAENMVLTLTELLKMAGIRPIQVPSFGPKGPRDR